MKRLLVLLLTVALIFGSIASAEEFTVTPNPPKGINYSYKYNAILFKVGAKQAIMDKYLYPLTVAPEEVGDDVYVALNDLQAMYAPDFTIEATDSQVTVQHVGLTAVLQLDSSEAKVDDHAYTFKNPTKMVDGVILVPALELMQVCFAKETKKYNQSTDNYYAIAYTNGQAISTTISRGLEMFEEQLAGEKKYGFMYMTYVIPDDPDQKVLPLRMYIPTTYDPAVPNKAVVMLHGGSRSMDFFYTDTNDAIKYYRPIEQFAEELGYILISGTAYMVSGSYGNVNGYPIASGTKMDELDEQTKELRMRSEKSVMVGLETAMAAYNIDSDHLYLMGNSMGGFGALLIGNQYPDTWKAIAPSGGTFNFRLFDENFLPNLVDKPILFVLGTEDEHGFGASSESYYKFQTWVNHADYYWVGGGKHSTSWAQALDKIFAFFEANQ